MPGNAKSDVKLGFFFVAGGVAFLVLFGLIMAITGGFPGLRSS